MGGAKISDKIGIIKNLIRQADYILIGGAMSYTFLKAKGYEVGKCLYEEEEVKYCKYLLSHYKNRIILPEDLRGSLNELDEKNVVEQNVEELSSDFVGLDIGTKTIEKFNGIIKDAKTIFWNGPVGAYEYEPFRKGTKEVLKFAKDNVETIILGGGDIVGCSNLLGYTKDLTFASTGGGATLKYLEDHNQPGLMNME